MNNNNFIDEIIETKWSYLGKWFEPTLGAEVWLEYGDIAQNFFNKKLDKKILYLNGNFFLSMHDSNIFQIESYEAAKHKDKFFFERIYNSVKRTATEMIKEESSITSIINFLKNYKKLTGVWMPLNNIAIGIEKYVKETNPEAFLMSKGFIDEKPWMLRQIEEMNLLNKKIENAIGKKIKNQKEIPIKYIGLIKKHIKQYEWIGTHHFNVSRLTIDNLIQRMQQGQTKTPNSLSEKNDNNLSYLIWLLDLIGYTRFKAAETSGYITYYLRDRLALLAKEKGVSYKDITEHTINEIATKKISKKTADSRRKNIGFYFNGKEHLLSKKQISFCLSRLLNSKEKKVDEFSGLSAQLGKIRGIVKIVTKQDQMKGFRKGMILVAHETTPDVIFAMQKSAAIVTDFGGLTSHAAIVARELKKPCIVGSKLATKILKDGDLVEVDANQGIVRILKRK